MPKLQQSKADNGCRMHNGDEIDTDHDTDGDEVHCTGTLFVSFGLPRSRTECAITNVTLMFQLFESLPLSLR